MTVTRLKPRLRVIAPIEHRPQDELRVEIRKRDWGRVHIEGDRRPALAFVPAPQWLASGFHWCRGRGRG